MREHNVADTTVFKQYLGDIRYVSVAAQLPFGFFCSDPIPTTPIHVQRLLKKGQTAPDIIVESEIVIPDPPGYVSIFKTRPPMSIPDPVPTIKQGFGPCFKPQPPHKPAPDILVHHVQNIKFVGAPKTPKKTIISQEKLKHTPTIKRVLPQKHPLTKRHKSAVCLKPKSSNTAPLKHKPSLTAVKPTCTSQTKQRVMKVSPVKQKATTTVQHLYKNPDNISIVAVSSDDTFDTSGSESTTSSSSEDRDVVTCTPSILKSQPVIIPQNKQLILEKPEELVDLPIPITVCEGDFASAEPVLLPIPFVVPSFQPSSKPILEFDPTITVDVEFTKHSHPIISAIPTITPAILSKKCPALPYNFLNKQYNPP